MLDHIGSIPCETCPRMKAEEVVGATAFKVAFLLPVPLRTFGSPNFLASASEASYDLFLINLNISLTMKIIQTSIKKKKLLTEKKILGITTSHNPYQKEK